MTSRGRGAGGGGRPAKRPVVHAQAALQLVTEALLDRKAVDPLVLDLRGLSAATDYFVIVSGTSDAHVRGMAEHLVTTLAPRGLAPHHVEGLAQGRWVSLDYVDFIVHVFHPELREFYQLERLWGDAPVLAGGTGGVTEFFKHRMVLPFTGSYAELEHVIGHEMVHQFQYDVFSRGRIGAGVQTLINVNPPLWFMEGMAEYLSIGPIDPHTSMWLRDASLEGHLPTIEQLTYDPRIFPYRFGHALWAYIGEKWGDEVIGEILQASTAGGVEAAFKRALGLSLDDLSSEWRDAVQTTYLPQLAEHYRARRIAQPVLTQKRSDGTYHLAPALAPDGRDIAYFSERNSFFVDLYLADAETGRVKRRLVRSTLSNNYESLRFINSAGSFSPDGRYFAIAAKHKDKDDLVILDVKKDEEVRRIG